VKGKPVIARCSKREVLSVEAETRAHPCPAFSPFDGVYPELVEGLRTGYGGNTTQKSQPL